MILRHSPCKIIRINEIYLYLKILIKIEEKGMTENEMVGWHHRFNRELVMDREGPGALRFMGSQRVEYD